MMTNDPLAKKPFYCSLPWFRFVMLGLMFVLGTEIFATALRMVLQGSGIDYENMFFYQLCSHFLKWSNYPVLLAWDWIAKFFFGGHVDQMLSPWLILIFGVLLLYWIFLGLVLGTILYLIWQRFFQH